MRGLLLCICMLFCFTAPPSANAAIVIDGIPVSCVTFNGMRVIEVANPNLGDAGRASFMPSPVNPYVRSIPVIEYDPTIFESFGENTFARLFFYTHECGHHTLGHLHFINPNSETQADCWAIKVGREAGWLSRDKVEKLGAYFAKNPGGRWGHLPGPKRLENFLRCFDDPVSAIDYRTAVVTREIAY